MLYTSELDDITRRELRLSIASRLMVAIMSKNQYCTPVDTMKSPNYQKDCL
jgi:hypothetical protein